MVCWSRVLKLTVQGQPMLLKEIRVSITRCRGTERRLSRCHELHRVSQLVRFTNLWSCSVRRSKREIIKCAPDQS